MYYSAHRIIGYTMHALDGRMGRVADVLFSDEDWSVRFLVVELVQGRRVLVAAPLLGAMNIAERTIDVHLDARHIEESPNMGMEPLATLQDEARLYSHYGWPSYWNGFDNDGVFGKASNWLPHPEELGIDRQQSAPGLRSTLEMLGYRVEARDGTVGRLSDLVVDDETWSVRYLIVHTRAWLQGRHVLVMPDWIHAIHPEETEVVTDHSGDDVRNSPELPDLDD